MDTLNQEIGRRISEIRKTLDINQTQFGEMLGIGKTTVSKYEKGGTKRGIPTEDLVKIAKIGNKSLDWLVAGIEPRYGPEEITIEDAIIKALRSKPEVAEKIGHQLIGEKEEEYKKEKTRLSQDEEELIDHYRQADQLIRKAAFGMLRDNAQESRRNDGGGSNSAEGNCA